MAPKRPSRESPWGVYWLIQRQTEKSALPLNQFSEEKRWKKRSHTFSFAIALSLSLEGVAGATVPIIYDTVAGGSAITIAGTNFSPSGLAPTVTFAATQLVLASFANGKIVARLPSGYVPGTYALNREEQRGPNRWLQRDHRRGRPSRPPRSKWPAGPKGSQGQPGAQGPAGPQGPPGPAGVSHAYSATFNGSIIFGNGVGIAGGNLVQIVSLTLPAGSYALNARVMGFLDTVFSDGQDPFNCTLGSDATTADTVSLYSTSGGSLYSSTIVLLGTINLPSPTQVPVQCNFPAAGRGSSGNVTNAQMAATLVGGVN